MNTVQSLFYGQWTLISTEKSFIFYIVILIFQWQTIKVRFLYMVRSGKSQKMEAWNSFSFSDNRGHGTYIRWYLRSHNAYTKINFCYLSYLICLGHLNRSKAVRNRTFILQKDLFFFSCSQNVLSYHIM